MSGSFDKGHGHGNGNGNESGHKYVAGDEDRACKARGQAPSIAAMLSRVRFGSVLGILMGLSMLVVVEACAKDSGGSGGTGSADKPPSGATANAARDSVTPPAAPTASGFGVPLSANKCPSAVPGSTTTVKELPDGVEITVVAPGGPPINDIRQRGVQIIAAGKDTATGAGSAADGLAKCPVVVKDTIIAETDVPGGAAFVVKPVKATALADLKKETKARASSYVVER